ncbi:MAG: PspC domain-containing protein [Anaerolineaceae bacterium]|nr:PspC domain-containing protein [Anaerolineaceae bacterium]MCY3906950.1 PspC domain-containing protein [Anaerolineaceae bacterium]
MKRKLYRSLSDRQLAGVCGGLASFLGVDAAITRLLLLFLVLAGGPGVLVNLVMAVVVPVEPRRIIFEEEQTRS